MLNFIGLSASNLNMLGTREPTICGAFTLAQINNKLRQCAEALETTVQCFQSISQSALLQEQCREG